MEFEIDDDSITFARGVEGVVGEERVLLDADDDLTAGRAWSADGYCVADFLDDGSWERLRAGLAERVNSLLAERDLERPDIPEQYHRAIGDRSTAHLEIAREAGRGFPLSSFPIDVGEVVERIGRICGVAVRTGPPGSGEDVFNMRIVRPCSNDNNPLHRDVWLDHLRNAINIYVPLAGSTERSSLALVPGSHRWKESEIARTPDGALVNNVRYSVPSVVGATRSVRVVRPNPGANQVLVFSPYLIHGGASNGNADATRISLEMRFWRDGA